MSKLHRMKPFRALGYVFYLLAVLIPIPAVMLLCSVAYNAARRVGRCVGYGSADESTAHDFFQDFVGICTWMLGIKHSFIPHRSTIAPMGTVILANHRSWCDFPLDNHLTRATVISRASVQYAMLLAGALQVYEQRVLRFHRGRTNSERMYGVVDAYMRRHQRNIMLYPEGTRRRHVPMLSAAEAKSTLRPGLLWRIYTNGQYPVQVVISSNKERVLNERSWSICIGVAVRTYVGTVIHPRDFGTFDGFMDAIADQWHEALTMV